MHMCLEFDNYKIVDEYLKITGQKTIDKQRFEIIDIPDEYPIERINKVVNQGNR